MLPFFHIASAVATPADGLKWLLAKEQVAASRYALRANRRAFVKDPFTTWHCVALQCSERFLFITLCMTYWSITVEECWSQTVWLFQCCYTPMHLCISCLQLAMLAALRCLTTAFPKMSWDDTNFIAALKVSNFEKLFLNIYCFLNLLNNTVVCLDAVSLETRHERCKQSAIFPVQRRWNHPVEACQRICKRAYWSVSYTSILGASSESVLTKTTLTCTFL